MSINNSIDSFLCWGRRESQHGQCLYSFPYFLVCFSIDDFLVARVFGYRQLIFLFFLCPVIVSFFVLFKSAYIEKGDCKFDTEEFYSLLDFAKTFPKEIDYDSFQMYESIKKGDAFFANAYIGSFSDYQCIMDMFKQAGEVVGLMQQPATDNDTLSYAVSARFADSLRISGFGMNEATLLQTKIKKELPDDQKEAVLALYMASSRQDSASYVNMVEDFIRKFPKASDGYLYRAQIEASTNNFAAAEKDMETAISNSTQKDDTHYNYARMIYNKIIFQADVPYDNWTLDKALDEIRLANTLNPQPTYRQMEANILFGQKKYNEAYDIYSQLSNTNLKGAEVYFSAARCKEMLKDSTAMLALLDSAMNCFTKPYLKEAAPYLWARAQARLQAKKYRDAISDMNDYEELMVATINDNFYYLRHQAEVDGRLYQQALNDITRAIVMNPKETFYYAEKASLEIRVGLYDNAIATAKESITIDANDSDGYLFLGVAQCLKGNKKEGIPNLQKAKDMGNLQAEALIEKYK